MSYGKQLGLHAEKIQLSDSGYRMFKNQKFELFVDIGHVGASYQPAHVHSDTFNFILHVGNKPVFVDTGVSTYEKNGLRQSERSTSSHNTVQIGNNEQTQVWGGFRVAKRANIIRLLEKDTFIEAEHDGYNSLGNIHSRSFEIGEDFILLKDIIKGEIGYEQAAYFHLHPSISNLTIEDSKVFIGNKCLELNFEGENLSIEKVKYSFAAGFNKTLEAIKLKVLFESSLETTIQL